MLTADVEEISNILSQENNIEMKYDDKGNSKDGNTAFHNHIFDKINRLFQINYSLLYAFSRDRKPGGGEVFDIAELVGSVTHMGWRWRRGHPLPHPQQYIRQGVVFYHCCVRPTHRVAAAAAGSIAATTITAIITTATATTAAATSTTATAATAEAVGAFHILRPTGTEWCWGLLSTHSNAHMDLFIGGANLQLWM